MDRLKQKKGGYDLLFLHQSNLIHERVTVVSRRDQGFLDGSSTGPTPEVEHAASLVVCT